MALPPEDGRPSLRRPSQYASQLKAAQSLGVPELFVEVKAHDGSKSIEKIESEVALLWPCANKDVYVHKKGKTAETPIVLPNQVGKETLGLLLEYCRFHKFSGRSDKERKIFDEKFIRLDTRRLCELTSAADSLEMKTLVELSSRALARMIEGKTPEEIRETFHLPDDLTEEEKLEPVKNVADDPRIRLLNRLYAKKRKELAEKKEELKRMEEGLANSAPSTADTRPLEDLLSFIQEDKSKEGKGRGKKKKSKKKRDSISSKEEPAHTRTSSEDQIGSHLESPAEPQREMLPGLSEQDANRALAWFEGNDYNEEELDDEIEAFARSLAADWEERRKELMQKAGILDTKSTDSAQSQKPLDDLLRQHATKLVVSKENGRLVNKEGSTSKDRHPESLSHPRLAESDAAQSSGAQTPLRPVFAAREDPDQQYPQARVDPQLSPGPIGGGTPRPTADSRETSPASTASPETSRPVVTATLQEQPPSPTASSPKNVQEDTLQSRPASESSSRPVNSTAEAQTNPQVVESDGRLSGNGQSRLRSQDLVQPSEVALKAQAGDRGREVTEQTTVANHRGVLAGKLINGLDPQKPPVINGSKDSQAGAPLQELCKVDSLTGLLEELAWKLGFEVDIHIKSSIHAKPTINGTPCAKNESWSISHDVEGLGSLAVEFTPFHRKVEDRFSQQDDQ